MNLSELEEQTVRRWIDFFKNSPLLQEEVTGEVLTESGTANRLIASNYNIVKSSIAFSDAVVLLGHEPYDSNGSQISAIIVDSTSIPFTVNYKYNPFAILTRSRKSIDESLFHTPRLFVLWGNSISMPYSRQQNDAGKLVTRRRGYLTLVIDVDDRKGGYPLKASLVGKVWAAIEGSRDVLYALGFEDITVEEIPTFEDFNKEEPNEVSRGLLMIAFTVYPEIRR